MIANTQQKQHIELAGQQVVLLVRRHRAAKRVSLRMTHAGDGIVLTLPVRASITKALAFVQQKSDWVLQRLAEIPETISFDDGVTISILGVPRVIHHKQGRGVTTLLEDSVLVFGEKAFIARRVKDMLKKHLHTVCHAQATNFSRQLAVTIHSIHIRDMKSRWGSCTASGRLAFNWRLVFAPEPVVNYLVAHEVAHLKEMNHSSRFWQCVSVLCPDYARARAWLKQHGQQLYRLG